MEWMEYVISILSGLVVTIPLVIKLVEYVQQVIKEKNWNVLLKKVMELMQTAEVMFETGAERKEWVLAMIQTSANTINYDIDLLVVSDMIDSLCSMSKVVNGSKQQAGD